MTDDPCPRCGPLEDRIRELELALADVTDQLTETARRVEESEQALAEANGRRCDNCKHGRIDRSYALAFDEPERIVFCVPLGSFQRGAWYCADFKPKPPEEGTGK